jgi:integral membrane protein (TIGR01906 family)
MACVDRSTNRSRLGTIAVGLATAVAIVALAIAPYLNTGWVSFEQGRTGVAALTGFSESEVRTVTGAILDDLVTGPPDFDVELNGAAVLTEAERSHMRDVRGVFSSFFAMAALALGIVGAAFWIGGRPGSRWTRRDAWIAVRRGAVGLGVAVVAAGAIALLAFDAAFEVFHRLFFPAGSYLFDPRTSRLVQLFPDAFWTETAFAVGGMILVLAAGTAWLAGRRLRAPSAPAASAARATERSAAATVPTAERGSAG